MHLKHLGTYVYCMLTLTPLVDEQWRWFGVGGLDPGWEQTPFVRLVPQILIQVGICDLLQRLNIIHRHQVTVEVHEFNANLQQTTILKAYTGRGHVETKHAWSAVAQR